MYLKILRAIEKAFEELPDPAYIFGGALAVAEIVFSSFWYTSSWGLNHSFLSWLFWVVGIYWFGVITIRIAFAPLRSNLDDSLGRSLLWPFWVGIAGILAPFYVFCWLPLLASGHLEKLVISSTTKEVPKELPRSRDA